MLKALFILLLVLVASVQVFAQDAVAAAPIDSGVFEGIAKFLSEFVATFAVNHPWVSTAIAAIGVLRVVMKPLNSLIAAIIAATSTKADDNAYAAVQASTAYRWVMYALDWFTSIKAGPSAIKVANK